MSKRKLTRPGKKDYRVTARLDANTWLSLMEAMEQGKITNLSEALRSMIAQKLWEQRFSNEIERNLKLTDVNDEYLRGMMKTLLGDLGVSQNEKLLMMDGFLEGIFSSFGGLMKRAILELERRDADKNTERSQAGKAH